MKYTTPILVGSLILAVSLLGTLGVIEVMNNEETKYNNALKLIKSCPVDSVVAVELSTSIFSKGIKVTCTYRQFVKKK